MKQTATVLSHYALAYFVMQKKLTGTFTKNFHIKKQVKQDLMIEVIMKEMELWSLSSQKPGTPPSPPGVTKEGLQNH